MRPRLSAPRPAWVILALLASLGRPLAASGGSSLTWLDGTQPWDSTPYKECDLQVSGAGGDGQTRGGIAGQAGILDEVQVSGQVWRPEPLPRNAETGELDLRLRESDAPEGRPAFSVYGRAPYIDQTWSAWGGLAAAMDPWDSSLAANAEIGGGGRFRLRLACWTPYLAPTLRLGAEASWLDTAAEAYTPQVLVNAPGDISVQAGVRFDAQGGAPLWTARLSYQLFPNP